MKKQSRIENLISKFLQLHDRKIDLSLDRINRLNKDVIVVPDRDEAGSKLVQEAIELGWGVSMPDWDDNINDIGEAVNKHGRLYALHKIVSSAETSPLKIRLKEKKWFY